MAQRSSAAAPALGVGPDLAAGSALRRRIAAELDRLEVLTTTNPHAAFTPAADLERQARHAGAVGLEMRARLVQADVLGRIGKTAAGGQLLRQVNAWAVEERDDYVLARSHRLLATFFDRIGDFAAGLEHALRAVELLSGDVPLRLRADHVFCLAMALLRLHSFDEARERYRAVLDIAEELGDDLLAVKVLNDFAWLEDEAGDSKRSMELALHMKAFADGRGITMNAACLDTLAHAQFQLGQYEQAIETLRPILEDPALATRETEGLAEALRTAAAAQRRVGDHAGAQTTLSVCLRMCEERHLADVRVQVLLEQADVFAAEGRFREAYEQMRLFHDESEELHSAEREARSRTLQAVFEIAEARREEQRFRELALEDALTGLRNRRYVDAELPALVRAAADGETPLALALVDLDHFKRINDTLSHAVGDEVLCRVAAILDSTMGERGFAARMGGEEFLLVLPGVAEAEAHLFWEAARIQVGSYAWQALTAGLPVTVSVGGTSVAPGRATMSTLLGQADRNLYVAKRGGRDRVVTDSD